ncbi:MAG: putative transposase [Roseomonas sp.]|nr:putative transposase [Roseomonas sp.]
MLGLFPFLLKLYADSGYQGPKFQQGLSHVCRQINAEIVKRSDVAEFVVLPKRWSVETTFAWLNRCRRLAKDLGCLKRNTMLLNGAEVERKPCRRRQGFRGKAPAVTPGGRRRRAAGPSAYPPDPSDTRYPGRRRPAE